MKLVYYHKAPMRRVAALLAVLFVFGWVSDAHAQWITKWLAVGRLHHPYLSGGAEPENLIPDAYAFWPGIRPGTTHNHWKGLWVSAANWTDETGREWDVRTSHIGPRILGLGEVFDLSHEMVARFEPPVVTVDGFETFSRPVTVEEVNTDLDPDRMVHSLINTSVGIQLEKRAMQWSNEYHDSYHIIEYIFTNTGNIDDDEEVELEGQTLNDVYFVFLDRPKINAPSGSWDNSAGGMAWGEMVMNDAVGEGIPNDYGVDFRAQFSWIGRIPAKSEYNTIGNPMWYNHQWNSVANDTLGRLGGAQFFGQVILHADESAHAPAEYNAHLASVTAPGDVSPDDPLQPHTMTYVESDWSDITTGNDHTNESKMDLERQFIERGAEGNPIHVAPEGANPRTFPTQAYVVHPASPPNQGVSDFSEHFKNQTALPSLGRAGGWGWMNGFGPYTMAPGEQVKIVMAEGVAGLSHEYGEAAWTIGRQYKLSGANDALQIPFDADGDGVIQDDENLTKNEWVMTARDSLFQLFERAIANYNSGYSVPHPPLPPRQFDVTSGTDQISLQWQAFDGAPAFAGWEVWRAQKDYNGIVTALRVGSDGLAIPDEARAYELIATLDPSATSYTDTDVDRGISYFYYLQAVGNPNTDPTGNTPTGVPLKSSRYYSQTYEPAFLRRAPGGTLSEVRIVPNPYNLAATTDVRFGDRQDKLAFYGLPALATIKIYTELGELVETLEHTDGSGDEFWFLTTSSRQLIVSGIYIAVIENKDPDSDQFGEQLIRKFIIIR